jgi:hypothetical protein
MFESHPLPLRATIAVLEDGALRVSTRTSVVREELGVSGTCSECSSALLSSSPMRCSF